MSGGHFDYDQYRIISIADSVAQLISCNNNEDTAEENRTDYSPETIKKFQEAEDTLRKAAAMTQRIDYLVSGDDGEVSFHERWGTEVLGEKIKNNEREIYTQWREI